MHVKNVAPVSVFCFCPTTNLCALHCIEDACKTHLDPARQINDVPNCPITLSAWRNNMEHHMLENGTDSIACVLTLDNPVSS
jgi:hypothetical protein